MGKFTYLDGFTASGNLEHDLFVGNGHMVDPSGTIIEGHWIDEKDGVLAENIIQDQSQILEG